MPSTMYMFFYLTQFLCMTQMQLVGVN